MYSTIYTALVWAFSFWMVADVVRRRLNLLWIALILLIVPPYGGLLYLVYLKLATSPRFRGMLGVPASSSTLPAPGEEAANPALLRADQLEEQRRYEEAAELYERALEKEPEAARALHGLARCWTELGEERAGLEKYEALMAVDPRYRNYAGALEYAEVLHRSGRTEDAIGLLDGLVNETGRFNHRLALAHYCAASGQKPRAQSVLNEALVEYERAPAPEQEANRRWQRRILDKLTELTTG
jgi:tetratricopeptide (TPR) repeat protein